MALKKFLNFTPAIPKEKWIPPEDCGSDHRRQITIFMHQNPKTTLKNALLL